MEIINYAEAIETKIESSLGVIGEATVITDIVCGANNALMVVKIIVFILEALNEIKIVVMVDLGSV